MTQTPNFNWIPCYEQFAQELLTYKNRRPELLQKIYGALGDDDAKNFHDRKSPDGERLPLEDIDPFSVFALFNRPVSKMKKRAIALSLSRAFGVVAPADLGFDGLPTAPTFRSYFYPFEYERNPEDIDTLWNLLEIADKCVNANFLNPESRAEFCRAFDAAKDVKYVAEVKLSMALYWAFPQFFPPLDQHTQAYLKPSLGVEIPNKFDGFQYLEWRDELALLTQGPDPLFIDFPDLAWQSWQLRKPKPPKPVTPVGPPIYDVNSIVEDGCFLPKERLQDILDSWNIKQNLILQGPPGTGKTWLAKRMAYALVGTIDSEKIKSVQFHPNMSYEDFVRGFRPNQDGRLEVVNGVFMEVAEAAAIDPNPEHKYVVVIEEINRGNPAMIFGELLTLMEADKRNEANAIELTYSDQDGNKTFFVPPNLYIIGTMNIADRSLAMVDLALRRRFAFVDLKPELEEKWLAWVVDHCNLDATVAKDIQNRMKTLNTAISESSVLGTQYQIGHSFVTPPKQLGAGDEETKRWFKQVAETEIYPLLEEYWYDSPSELEAAWKAFTQSSDAFPWKFFSSL